MKAAANPPVSEFESPKLKIAGKVQFFRANTGFSVEAYNKIMQKQEIELLKLFRMI